jgi:DNA-binding transcriptional regulator YhcF (GntR family)
MEVHPLDPGSGTSPYEQLRSQLASRAASGDLPAGTRLPTVRGLAEQLGVAAGTVARAYRELEADGVVVTEGRRGTFVASSATATDGSALTAAQEYAGAARRLGLTRAEAVRLLEEAWS